MCDLGTGRNEIGPLLGWFKSHIEEEDEEWTLWTIGIWLSYWHRRGNPCILRKADIEMGYDFRGASLNSQAATGQSGGCTVTVDASTTQQQRQHQRIPVSVSL